jgi:hypothetical protein
VSAPWIRTVVPVMSAGTTIFPTAASISAATRWNSYGSSGTVSAVIA